MKTKSIYFASTVSVLALTMSVYAADHDRAGGQQTNRNYRQSHAATVSDQSTATRNARNRNADNGTYEHEALGDVVKANDIIGRTMRNQQDERLGEVEDLGVDLKAGRIVYVVVSTGGILGVGGKNIAVPPQALQCDHERKVVRLDVTKERLKDAPKFEMTRWDDYSQSNRVAEIYGYYDQHPYFTQIDRHKRTPHYTPTLGAVMRASKVIGMPVRNQQDDKLGTVNNMMINLERGRVSQLIVASGGFLGVGDELSVMPPAAFNYDADAKYLVIDATKESLTSAPRFKSKEWPNFSDPEYAGEVYRAYQVEPYFNTRMDTDNTRRNVRDRDSNQPTPLDQGTSPADVDTTRKIRQELVAQENLSVLARNVKIITRNGEITLRGPVNTQEEKRQIAEIVTRHAANARVNNQLEVKGQNN